MLCCNSPVRAQDHPNLADTTECVQSDLPDILREAFRRPPKLPTNKSGSVLLIPIIGSNPATGFMFGVGGQYAFKLTGQDTRYSMLAGSVQGTSKKQMLLLLKNNIYTKNNNIFLTGDWRYLIFSQNTYGLGTNSPEGGILDQQFSLAGMETSADSLAQPMNFNFLRFYQSVSFQLRPSFYLGVGYFLDYYFKIRDERLRLNPGDTLLTSHYAYNTHYGFDLNKYQSSAINLNLIYDSRDNMINPYRGQYVMINWSGAMKWMGNKKNGSFLTVEWRSFYPLSARNPRHLMSFWLLGNFTPTGEFPYMILPATAYDQRSRSARGYTQGRFRGNNMVYGEAEYRFPLSGCTGVWGGVLFLNATTADNPALSLPLFGSIKPGYGLGLRVMVDKKTRTNLAIDVGFGNRSSGFYLAASETF